MYGSLSVGWRVSTSVRSCIICAARIWVAAFSVFLLAQTLRDIFWPHPLLEGAESELTRKSFSGMCLILSAALATVAAKDRLGWLRAPLSLPIVVGLC